MLNQISKFGIGKLCTLNLNEQFEVVDRIRPKNILDSKQTLISFAAYLRRDAIVSALLRAGADPSVSLNIQSSTVIESSVNLYLLERFPMKYAVWLVITVINAKRYVKSLLDSKLDDTMIQESVARPSLSSDDVSTKDDLLCCACRQLIMGEKYIIQWNSCKETGIFSCSSRCSHISCEECTWRHVCSPKTLQAFRCPGCLLRCDGGPEKDMESFFSEEFDENEPKKWYGLLLRGRLERERQSYSQWLALPLHPSSPSTSTSHSSTIQGNGTALN